MYRCVTKAALTALFATAASVHSPALDQGDGFAFFEGKIRPLLAERCFECHSSSSKKIKGGLTLDSRERVLKGGDSGPAIAPGSPEKSLLIKAIRYGDKDLQMPPKHQLALAEIALLEDWVKMGAPDPRTNSRPIMSPRNASAHWAFQPLSDPCVLTVKNARWPSTSIDNFILAKLESKDLAPNFAADKRTLIRRATFDLIGLPPTPEEVAAFINNSAPDSFEKLLDRLLASPHYGERWGRYWLDLARYADTAGDSADYPVPQAYKYRNYVIEAFNTDKPYDEFIREQVAGDLLPAKSQGDRRQKSIATGYLALARRFSVDPQSAHHLTLEDTIDMLGKSVLGLSLSCARCHDHKYDPIPTQDYYGLYGIFNSTRYPFAGSETKKRPADLVPLIPVAEFKSVAEPFHEALKAIDDEISGLERERETLVRERLSTRNVREALDAANEKRDELIAAAPVLDLAFAVTEGKAGNARVQRRGEPGSLGEEVPRHFLRCLGGQSLPKTEMGSGRLELASWLTAPTNPLTARVMVNRVWQHHFGKGLVQTPSDFGARGRPPTHPELLDDLARRFMQSGWSVKALHKFIMLSSTYQQASLDDHDYAKIDPANDLLWRFNRHRLDAEAIRDTMLMLAGQLDLAQGGPHPFPSEYTWDFTQHGPFTAIYDTNKRSVYLMQQRIKKHPYFATFDAADANSSTAERPISTTPLQALFMMNDKFVHEQAAQFAGRVQRGCHSDPDRIQLAYALAFGRPARREEIREGLIYLERFSEKLSAREHSPQRRQEMAWASFARVILASDEFLYID